ncbi:MAG: hypothetical protein ACFE7E_04440 [Candidatus Hodarchaeota archaeon]
MSLPKPLRPTLILLIGGVLLTAGIGFSLFNNQIIPMQSGLSYLIFENNYSYNTTIGLESGDELTVYARIYENVNVSLVLKTMLGSILAENHSSDANQLLSISTNVNASDNYTISVYENQSTKYSTFRLFMIRSLSVPIHPYLAFGLTLAVPGIILTALGFRDIYAKKKYPASWEILEWHHIVLPVASFASLGAVLFLFNQLPLSFMFQDWQTILFFSIIVILNIVLVLLTTSMLKGRTLLIYSWALLIVAIIWSFTASLLLSYGSRTILPFLDFSDPETYYLAESWIIHFDAFAFQMQLLILIIFMFYAVTGSYENYKTQIYLESAIPLTPETLKEKGLDELKQKLRTLIKKKKFEGFFRMLRMRDLEASVILYYLLRHYIDESIQTMTLHGLLSAHPDIFSKTIYERKTVQDILAPLGYVRFEEGRIRNIQLRIELSEVSRLVKLLKSYIRRETKEKLEELVGVSELRKRKIKFAGLPQDEDAS